MAPGPLVGRFVERIRRCDRRGYGFRLAWLRHGRLDSLSFRCLRSHRTQADLGAGVSIRAFELAASLDHIGPMCRSAVDAGIVLGAIAGADPNDPTASQQPVPDYLRELDRELRSVRIGLDERYAFDGVEPSAAGVVRDALSVFGSLGAEIRQVQFPAVNQMLQDWPPNCAVETAVAHDATYPARKAEYGPGLAGLIESAQAVKVTDYQKILLRRRDFAGRVAALFQQIDLLIIPANTLPRRPRSRWRRSVGTAMRCYP